MFAEQTDAEMLGAIPDFLSLPGMLKASPHEEGGKRILYLEASNEDVDLQGEIVLQKALVDSTPYFLRHGNIDLGHFSILGPKHGIPNYMDYEVGKPIDVRTQGRQTLVKCELYTGESASARNATTVWESLTKQKPPMPWFPSVGGGVLAKSIRLDPVTGDRVAVVEQVRWNNIALDRRPVSRTVGEVSIAPIGLFAKSMGGWIMSKALEAGYGTDSATLTGGGALRSQSLYGADGKGGVVNYFDFREQLADALQKDKAGKNPRTPDLVKCATDHIGLTAGEAPAYVERFLRDIQSGLAKRKTLP